MTMILEILLGLALLGYLPLIVLLVKSRKKPVPKYDATAQELLHDLTRRDGAVLRIDVINPDSILLRR